MDGSRVGMRRGAEGDGETADAGSAAAGGCAPEGPSDGGVTAPVLVPPLCRAVARTTPWCGPPRSPRLFGGSLRGSGSTVTKGRSSAAHPSCAPIRWGSRATAVRRGEAPVTQHFW